MSLYSAIPRMTTWNRQIFGPVDW